MSTPGEGSGEHALAIIVDGYALLRLFHGQGRLVNPTDVFSFDGRALDHVVEFIRFSVQSRLIVPRNKKSGQQPCVRIPRGGLIIYFPFPDDGSLPGDFRRYWELLNVLQERGWETHRTTFAPTLKVGVDGATDIAVLASKCVQLNGPYFASVVPDQPRYSATDICIVTADKDYLSLFNTQLFSTATRWCCLPDSCTNPGLIQWGLKSCRLIRYPMSLPLEGSLQNYVAVQHSVPVSHVATPIPTPRRPPTPSDRFPGFRPRYPPDEWVQRMYSTTPAAHSTNAETISVSNSKDTATSTVQKTHRDATTMLCPLGETCCDPNCTQGDHRMIIVLSNQLASTPPRRMGSNTFHPTIGRESFKGKACPSFTTSTGCPKGKNCLFLHPIDQTMPLSKQDNIQRGKCACCICLEDSFGSKDGIWCSTGQHFICNEDLFRYTKTSWKERVSYDLPALSCPTANCVGTFPEHALRQDAAAMQAYHKVQEKAKSILSARKNPQELKDEAMILQTALPRAYMCPECKFGPVDFGGCANLNTHDGQESSGGVISNRCPMCGWRTHCIDHWGKWDGVTRTVEELKQNSPLAKLCNFTGCSESQAMIAMNQTSDIHAAAQLILQNVWPRANRPS